MTTWIPLTLSLRNLERAYCTAWNSNQKCKYKDFTVFGQIHFHIDENQTPCPHHGICGGHQQWWYYASIYFSHDLKLKIKAYIECLEKLVLPWIERVASGRPYVNHKSRSQSCL